MFLDVHYVSCSGGWEFLLKGLLLVTSYSVFQWNITINDPLAMVIYIYNMYLTKPSTMLKFKITQQIKLYIWSWPFTIIKARDRVWGKWKPHSWWVKTNRAIWQHATEKGYLISSHNTVTVTLSVRASSTTNTTTPGSDDRSIQSDLSDSWLTVLPQMLHH